MNETCNKCKKFMDHKVKHIVYYANGQAFYSRLCTECTRQGWIDFAIENHELLRVKNELGVKTE